LNAVKTGLAGRTILLADEEEAAQYRAHIERLLVYWRPRDTREHALVQALADTQWRLDSIPGLESGLYALGRLRGADQFPDEDPQVRRLLLDAQTEETEAKAFKNLRLHERRLRQRYQQDEAELIELREMRFAEEEEKKQEEAQRQQEEADRQRRQEQARQRAARKQARQAAITPVEAGLKPAVNPNGFEFSTSLEHEFDSAQP
jgi:hypothetical protein